MSSRKFLLPLAGILAIGLAIAGWTSRPAQAGVGAVTPSTLTPTVGVPMTITVAFDANTAAASSNTLFVSSGAFSAGTVSTAEAVSGVGTSALGFVATAAGARTLTATYTCAVAGPVSFTASQQGGTPISASAVVTCGGQAVTGLTVNPNNAGLNTQVQITGTCTAGGQTLFASGGGSFGTVPGPQNGQINTPTSVVCTAPGTLVAYFYCNTVSTVTFTLVSSQGTLTCTAGQATGGITATPPSVPVGQSATISGNCLGGQTITASAGGIFQAVISGAQYVSQNSIVCGGGVFSATFTCGQTPVTVTFTNGTQTGTLGCGVAAAGGLTVNPTAGSATAVSGQCTIPGQQLTVTGTGTFVSATINGSLVPNVAGTTVVNCTSIGSLTAQFNCTTIGTANFNLGGITGTFQCTTGAPGTCPNGGIFNPVTGCTATISGVPAAITIAANPTSLQCSGSSSVSFIAVTVKDAQGQNAQDGTNVTITADSGTFAPSQATTLGGTTQFIYSPASTSSGTVNIKASAGSAQGQTTVNVACGNSTTAVPPVSAPVTSPPPPPPAGPVTIAPPNTGDAGLATASDRSNWQLYAATSIIVAVAAGAIALVRTKA